VNLDWSITEDELFQTFSKWGMVERARILRKVNSASKGNGEMEDPGEYIAQVHQFYDEGGGIYEIRYGQTW
jgi:hypothetical protein